MLARMSVGAVVGYAVGVTGIALAITRYWIDQRRARPIVICHEEQKRHTKQIAGTSYWAASVFLTNESAASAFNIRFGISVAGIPIPWKHDVRDPEPSRVNVLRPNERHPEKPAFLDVLMADQVFWSIADRDPDEGRSYWAYYQGPAGDWWYTSNPYDRGDDLVIRRIRSRRFSSLSVRNRRLDKALRLGQTARTLAIRELNEAARREPESTG